MTMHLLDTRPALRSTLIRKAFTYALKTPRAVARAEADDTAHIQCPPIVVNSIPKSGTHLLVQIARALPDARYYGSFIAWASSLDLKARDDATVERLLSALVPGEVAGAHLYARPQVRGALAAKNAVHLFIIRDPIDIVKSEAYYLKKMNRFHRMAREVRHLNQSECMDIILNGSKQNPDIYPSFEQRLEPYLGWLTEDTVCVTRYERLRTSATAMTEARRIVDHWRSRAEACNVSSEALAERLIGAINPSRSHTASRRSNSGDLSIDKALAQRLAPLRRRLGYI